MTNAGRLRKRTKDIFRFLPITACVRAADSVLSAGVFVRRLPLFSRVQACGFGSESCRFKVDGGAEIHVKFSEPALGGGYAGIDFVDVALNSGNALKTENYQKRGHCDQRNKKESSQLNSDFAFTQRDGKRNARFLRANLWLGFCGRGSFLPALGLSRCKPCVVKIIAFVCQ